MCDMKILWSDNVLVVKDWCVKVYDTIVHRKNLKKGFRETMSPRVLRRDDVGYECVKELDFAVSNKDCTNIALTGIYGSGKSSVIKTLLKKHRFKKVLRLSLSRYIVNEQQDFDEKEVERSIFQHILYKSNPSSTPQSKYHKINHRAKKTALLYAIGLMMIAWSVLTIWNPGWYESISIPMPLNDETIKKICEWYSGWKKLMAVVCMLLATLWLLMAAIRRSSKFGIRSIKIKDVDFDVNAKEEDFNSLLNEMLYYLKAGGYDWVIFEDLDRINDPKALFLKFREINLLLNESHYYRRNNKRIVFIYAIRDDVFQKEERTKFFDYIVPVIPVIDHFNASDYLLKNYKQELSEVDDKDIMTLGLYIGGMRELVNILNEYGVYKRTLLEKSMSQKKLLALLIYKSLFPQDFADAHYKKGGLYDIFENKQKFSHVLTEAYEKILEDVRKQIEDVRKDILKHRKVLTVWAEKRGNITGLIIDEKQYSLDKVIERDDLFQKVEANDVEYYVEEEDRREYRKRYDFTFNQILQEVDEDGAYGDGMEELNDRLYILTETKNKEQKLITMTSQLSLQTIIQTIGNSESTLGIATEICNGDEERGKLLHVLIRNGYIDDDYKSYLSFTYPGSKTTVDEEFLHSVLQGTPMDYTVELQNCEAIVASLHTDNYNHESILNYTLWKYLEKTNDDVHKGLFIQTARKHPDFIDLAYVLGDVGADFYKQIFDEWHHCIRDILQTSSGSMQNNLLTLFWSEAPAGLRLGNDEKAYLNGMYGLVCEKIDGITETAAMQVVKEYGLKFKKIRKANEETQKLYDYVLTNRCFEINGDNMAIIYGDDFFTSSYTQVKNGRKDVYEYVKEHIADFINIVPTNDDSESIEAIEEIVNSKELEDAQVRKFVGMQKQQLESLDNVITERYGLLFELDKVKSLWENVKMYFSKKPDEDAIVKEYIKRHADELSAQKCEEDEADLQMLLLSDNDTLTEEEYEKLAGCFSAIFEIEEIELLDEERLKVILNNGMIEYSKKAVKFFMDKSEGLYVEFIKHFCQEVVADDDYQGTMSNEVSIKLLNSDLTLEQKKSLLDGIVILNDDEGQEELAKLVCFYYSQVEMDKNADVALLVKALDVYHEDNDWHTKIRLINSINATFGYKAERETSMLNALGGGYPVLNMIGGVPAFFDKNEENETLMNFLRDEGHNVNKVKQAEDKLKVTFKRKN